MIQRRSSATLSESASPSSFNAIPATLITESSNQGSTSLLSEDIIVAEILPRLHVKALFRFKCVSVHYESIISDPKFGQKYLQRAYSSQESCSSSGLLASLLFPFMGYSFDEVDISDIKDLSDTINWSTHSQYPDDEDQLSICTVSLSCDHATHEIAGSSGGLLLCKVHLSSKMLGSFFLCVCNPLTKQCVPLHKETKSTDVFGFATRWDDAAASLTYKVVIFNQFSRGRNASLVFSSDTGNWVLWRASCPDALFCHTTSSACFSYKGALHWLDRRDGSVITYNPFDTPDQFRCIRLPEGKYSLVKVHRSRYPHRRRLPHLGYNSTSGQKKNRHRSLIYSGEEEMVKYCEIGKCKSESGVNRIMVWKLEDYDKGKWCLEGEFSVPSLKYACKRLMVAPYPWNRRVICHPYARSTSITVLNPWAGTWEWMDVFPDTNKAGHSGILVYVSPCHCKLRLPPLPLFALRRILVSEALSGGQHRPPQFPRDQPLPHWNPRLQDEK